MYGNTEGVAAFHFPDNPKKEPLIVVIATQSSGIELSPFVLGDEGCTVFNGEPEFTYWRGNLRTKDLTAREANELRMRALENTLDRVELDFKAITGNAKVKGHSVSSMRPFWRGTAEDIEAELLEAGRLLVRLDGATPAFEQLRKMDSKGRAQTCYLQAIYLAHKTGLAERTPVEREQAYIDFYGINSRNTFTLKG